MQRIYNNQVFSKFKKIKNITNNSKGVKKGDIFSAKNLTVKRPGNGISPLNWDKLIGKKSEINYKPDMLIKW